MIGVLIDPEPTKPRTLPGSRKKVVEHRRDEPPGRVWVVPRRACSCSGRGADRITLDEFERIVSE